MIPLNFEYLKYLIRDEKGEVIGISDDAPEEVKKQYYERLEARKNGMK
jgi:hypothetical protein